MLALIRLVEQLDALQGGDPERVVTGVQVMAAIAWALLILIVLWHGLRKRRRAGEPEPRLSGKDMRRIVLEATEVKTAVETYLVWHASSFDVDGRRLAHVSSRASSMGAFTEVLAMTAALDDTAPIDLPPPAPTESPLVTAMRTTQDDDDPPAAATGRSSDG
jgi:hypothetical protein